LFIAGAVVANLVVLAAIVAVPRERRDSGAADMLPARLGESPNSKYEAPVGAALADAGPAAFERVLRILWWLSIAGILIGVGVSGAFAANQPLIFALGAAAVVAVLVLHELIPDRWRTATPKLWIEALVAVGLMTGLLALTGYGRSPFFFTFPLVAVAVALARGGRATFFFAALASLAYVGLLAVDPERGAFSTGDLLTFGVNIGAIWILAYLAAVFAAGERRVRARVLQLSVTDPLTGLFNRFQIYATLEQEIRRTRRSDRGFCLLMIDLDGLKAVNDSFGHHRGDDVLRSLGRVIRNSIRTVDTAYRYGGDEFVILLPETEITGAYVVAEKIRAGVEEITVAMTRDELPTSVSIGLVSHPEDGQTVDELMIAADRAMYAAKSLGKNQISGYPRPRKTAPVLPAVPSLAAGQEGPMPAEQPAALAQRPTTQQPVGPGPIPPVTPTPAPAAEPAAVSVTPEPVTPDPIGPAPEPVAAETSEEVEAETEPSDGGEPVEGEDLTPAEARRRIAALSYDPDHQIRRAMDAFLGVRPATEEPPKGR
jgi:diguanylate cyclase (GGDEF)-like protein